jgi:hypothetical protein
MAKIVALFAVLFLAAPAFASDGALIYDTTSAANTAQDTGKLDVRRFDCLSIYLVTNGNTTASVSHEIYDASGTALAIDTAVLVTGKTRFVGSWGIGCSYAKDGLLGLAQALPPYVRLQVGALGSTITGRLVIVGRKK